jgi:ubiquinone biosynthesis protein UbiJ
MPPLNLLITPAGLLEWEPAEALTAPADLQVRVRLDNPLAVGLAALKGQWPAMQVEGDAALAADVNWLAQNLRWDVADDLHRLFGPGPAQFLSSGARQMAAALQAFVQGVAQQASPWWNRFRAGDPSL